MLTAAAINPGVMDRRAVLLERTTTRDSIGAAIEAWAEAATVWARWVPQNSREFIQAQARWSELAALLRIRWRSDLAATWRVNLGGTTYELAGPPLEIGRREYLELALVTVAALPAPPDVETGEAITDESGAAITDESGAAITS